MDLNMPIDFSSFFGGLLEDFGTTDFMPLFNEIKTLKCNNCGYTFDDIAAASAEIGLAFCTIVILTGPLWAKPAWGKFWTWDPRLTSTLLLWFIYVGYIMLRQFMDESDRRAKFSAAVGIIGFIDVPVVFLSIQWWNNTIHPNVVQKGGGGLHPDMLTAMLVCLGIFTIIYISLLIRRLRLINIERRIKLLETD